MKFCFKDYKILNIDETKAVLEIRNAPAVRNASANKGLISLDKHQKWVVNLEPNSYFALILDGKIVGGISLNREFWGIFFSLDCEPFSRLVFVYIFLEHITQKSPLIKSKIKKSNAQAVKFNQFFGFEICAEVRENMDDFYILQLSRDKFVNLLQSPAFKRVKTIAKSAKIEFIF